MKTCPKCGGPRKDRYSYCRDCKILWHREYLEKHRHDPCSRCKTVERCVGHYYCRDCVRQMARINYLKRQQDPSWSAKRKAQTSAIERTRAKGTEKYLRRKEQAYLRLYGLTKEEVDAKILDQEGKCAVCGAIPNGKGSNSCLHVDHDHRTGKFRGMLCNTCNRAEGYLKSDPIIAEAMLNYIRKHATTGVALQ